MTFVPEDEWGDDAEGRGPLTPRTRFMLYVSLSNIAADLDVLMADWPRRAEESTYESMVKDDMPVMVQTQPREWWQQMLDSAERLHEAARLGVGVDLVPRTPAEEALLALATNSGYVDWARDRYDMDDGEWQPQFEALPVCSGPWADYEWGEILGFLTGDVDIETTWMLELDGQEDPADEVNQYLGMGDYRPQAWHRLFERAEPHITVTGERPDGPGATEGSDLD